MISAASPRLAAFRYLYSSLRQLNRLPDYPAEVRRDNQRQIRLRIAALPAELRADALKALKDKERPYWFCPEWSSPAPVLSTFAEPAVNDLYLALSGTAHGGFLGMRFFREVPDRQSVQPEPNGRRGLSLDFYSCRFVLEFLLVRDQVQSLGFASEIRELLDQVRAAALAMPRAAT